MATRPTKRILMISTHGYVAAHPELGKPDTGGQVVFVLKLAESLSQMGYKVDIFTRQFEDQPAQETLNDNVRVLRFPCGGREFIGKEWLCDSIPEWVENAAKFIRARGLRYSFINSHYWDAGLAGMALGEEFNVPHFHTPHSIGAWKRDNMDGDPAENEQKYNFVRRVQDEAIIYAKSDLVIATTEEQRELLKRDEYQVPDDRLLVIPPGYDDRQFYPVSQASREALKRELDATGPIVLALGRMAHNKGYDLLIQSFATVVQRVPEARLLLAIGSSEPSAREIEQIGELKDQTATLGLQNRVLFRDYIPDDLLADYYRAADVFALSSRYEPFGMTAVEAMACGTPAVVTTQGGLWKMLTWGRDTIYANPFQPDEFGHALATVLQYPEVAARLSERASQTARAIFTWSCIAQQLVGAVQTQPRERSGASSSSDASSLGEESAAADPEPARL